MKIKFGDSSLNLKAGGSLANIDRGPRGYSAYEIAVQEGFVGTEEEWLASLVGPEGKQGKDGERGLEGPRGKEGPEGKQGIPGYTPVKGIDYFTEADIESLDIPKKTSDIQNDSGFIDRSVNNLVNYTLKTNTGSLIDLSIDNTNYVVTLKLKNQDGTVISTDNIDLPLESVVVGGSYDKINKKIVLTLENGNKVDIPVGDLIAGLQTEITSTNKLASDLVDDTNSGNKFTNISEKQAWNNKYDKPSSGIPATDLSGQVQTSLGKADTALQEHQDLTDYVKNTDYASDNKAGVTKNGNAFVVTNTNGVPYCSSDTYAQYQSSGNGRFISKGTLENVIAGKGLTTKSYVDGELEDKVDSDAYVQEQEVQDSNIEENASNIDWLQTLVNQMPTVSGQGTDLSLQSVLNYRLMKFLPQGGSSQDGEPTPTTPIPVKSVTGENSVVLQNENLFYSEMEQGAWVFNNGTSFSSNRYIRTKNKTSVVEGEIYTLSFKGVQPTNTHSGFVFYNNGTFVGSIQTKDLTFEVPNGANQVVYNLYRNSGITPNDIYDIILVKGSTAPTTYVEHEEQNYLITLKSDNLIGLDTAQYPVDLKVGDKITLTNQLKNTALQLNLYTNFGDSERNDYWNSEPGQSRTITVAKDSKAIAWSRHFSGLVWVNKGETSLSYKPYIANPIELNSTPDGTIRDEIIGTPNNWFKREYIGKVVLDGSETIQYTSANNRFDFNVSNIKPGSSENPNVISDNYTGKYSFDNYSIFSTSVGNQIAIIDNRFTSVNDFKTWLSTHNTTVWYIKAQYTDIPITDTTLISQLNDIYNNAHSYNGVTNITTTYEDGNEQMYLDIEALKNVWEVTE